MNICLLWLVEGDVKKCQHDKVYNASTCKEFWKTAVKKREREDVNSRMAKYKNKKN